MNSLQFYLTGLFQKDATKTIGELLDEGRAADKGFTPSKADSAELKKGVTIEKEHTSDPKIARKIALDHLSEKGSNQHYYKALKGVEGVLEKAEPVRTEHMLKKIEKVKNCKKDHSKMSAEGEEGSEGGGHGKGHGEKSEM